MTPEKGPNRLNMKFTKSGAAFVSARMLDLCSLSDFSEQVRD